MNSDAHRGAKGALERAERLFPFPVLDRIWLGEVGRGRKYVSASEVYSTSHFPGSPILPGVAIIAALATIATAMMDDGRGGACLRRVRRFRFHRPVYPGDVMELFVRPLGSNGSERLFEGEAFVGETLVARGRLAL